MHECQQCGRPFEPQFDNQPLCDECLSELRARHESGAPAPAPARKSRRIDWNEIRKSPTWIILGLNVLAFIVVAIKARSVRDFSSVVLMPFGANFGAYSLSNQPWRMLTAIFLHAGLLHIVCNMWALLNLGLLAELLFGAGPFLLLYLMAGIAGSLASSWWHIGAVGVGASGAIFGIAGALLPALALHPNPRLRSALRGSLLSIGIFVAYTLTYGAQVKHTDNAAHIGGLLMGIVLGFALPAIPVRTAELNSRRVVAFLAGAAILASGYFWAQHQRRAAIEFAQAFEYSEKGDLPRALDYAQRSVRHDPKIASSRFLLGGLYMQQGDNQRAVETLRRAVALKPDFASGYSQLCMATWRLEQLGEAVAACRRAAELDPRDPDKQSTLGLVLHANGELAESTKAFGRALALRPNGAWENFYYGVALLETGDPTDAIAPLTRAQQLNPNDEKVALALGRAKAMVALRSR